jgi:cytochrome c oxidase subunit II
MTATHVRRGTLVLVLGVPVFGSSGCGSGGQNVLDPAAPQARSIENLWWWMLVVALAVFLGAVALLVLGWLRRDQPGLPFFGERPALETGLVVGFGLGIPLVTVVALFFAADVFLIRSTDAPARASTALTVVVVGHQWFWEVRYPGTSAVTANEIHIPARTRVDVELETHDVIHSFWVPELNRKVDMIPGRTNRLLLDPEKPGVYRGQCAEFCGLQHAHMAFIVFVDPPDRFRAWLAEQARPAPVPRTDVAKRGKAVFLSQACASCHTIRGTGADGEVGPDLTHVASRTTLAANTIRNSYGDLAAWISDPQHVKPGNRMPAVPLAPGQLGDVAAYLETLK